jgi:hypothetical protein
MKGDFVGVEIGASKPDENIRVEMPHVPFRIYERLSAIPIMGACRRIPRRNVQTSRGRFCVAHLPGQGVVGAPIPVIAAFADRLAGVSIAIRTAGRASSENGMLCCHTYIVADCPCQVNRGYS